MTKITFVLSALLILTIKGLACDCHPTLSIKESYKSTPNILEVIVLEASYNKELDQSIEYLYSLSKKDEKIYFGPVHANQYILEVKHVFKGKILKDTILLRTALDPVTDCGLILEIGKSYILYAFKVAEWTKYHDNQSSRTVLTTNICTRTKEFSEKEKKELMTIAAKN